MLATPSKTLHIRSVQVTRYVVPLREGGSLPALVEADDGFMYVLKFAGAGQGKKALIAELLVGEIARILGLNVPELVFCHLDEAFGRTEPDEEIQDLLRASTGLNLGLHYLSGAVTFDALVTPVAPRLASLIVWLDAFTLNVDRTVRNTNLLMWHRELWLIDHGAGLYMHHNGTNWGQPAERPFKQVKDHVLLSQALELEAADLHAKALLTNAQVKAITELIPAGWLEEAGTPLEAQREAYAHFLNARLAHTHTFITEAHNAREALV